MRIIIKADNAEKEIEKYLRNAGFERMEKTYSLAIKENRNQGFKVTHAK